MTGQLATAALRLSGGVALTALALSIASCRWQVAPEAAAVPAASGDSQGYLGMILPASTRIFPDSLWTTPIGTDAEISPDSDAQIATLRYALVNVLGRQATLQVNVTRNSAPIHVVDRSMSPIVDVPCDSLLPLCLDPDRDSVAENVPVPDEVWPDPSDDSHLIIVDQVDQVAYEFWNWRKEGARQYRAGMAGKWNLASMGWNLPGSDPSSERNGATASRAPYIGGLIRYEDVTAGEIRHALHMVLATTRSSEFQAPAVSTDGRNVGPGFIPEGARLQLNPDLDLDSLGLTATARMIARALQVYGAYVMDTAAGWAIKAQNLGADGGAWKELVGGRVSLDGIPIEQFRVLK